MSNKYFFEKDKFVIKNFDRQKTFFSFLPGLAGKDGIPLWAFYCNRGQGICGFGVTDKATPITEFNPAITAEAEAPLSSFRTFVKINGKVIHCFAPANVCERTMEIRPYDFSIIEENKKEGYGLRVEYCGLPNEDFAALMRRVIFTNTSSKEIDMELVDGLSYIFPYGLTNSELKDTGNLRRSWSEVINLDKKVPFYKQRCTTNDTSETSEIEAGNFYLSFVEDNKLIDIIADTAVIFNYDTSLQTPFGFMGKSVKEMLKEDQTLENKILGGFSVLSRKLKAGESIVLHSIIGQAANLNMLNKRIGKIATSKFFDKHWSDAEKLVEELNAPIAMKTSDPLFDNYAKQCFFDNGLRGGFPTLIDNKKDGEIFYLYSRKHGDTERDYNWFKIPSTVYSSGNGNFRDVNQNRRNDLFFFPFVGDYNVKQFWNLVQIDGYNPLDVRVPVFELNEGEKADKVTEEVGGDEKLTKLLSKKYQLSDIADYVKHNLKESALPEILSRSHQIQQAAFGEGYWSDHWTYNLDLVENYLSVFPDKFKDLFYDNNYTYFWSPVFVHPRSEKYVMTNEGKVRQFDALEITDHHCGTDWLKDKKGKLVKTTLFAKMVHLALVKFATLDSETMGVEMESDKPGWNDAMNGVPGVMGSGVSESVELLRLIDFMLNTFKKMSGNKIDMLKEQVTLLKGVNKAVDEFNAGKFDRFAYWDRVATLREDFRASVRLNVSGGTEEVKVDDLNLMFEKFHALLEDGLNRAKKLGGGVLPSYLLFYPEDYALTGKKNRLGRPTVKVNKFKLKMVPLFLEAVARSYKLKNFDHKATHKFVMNSELYDKKCGVFKTSVSLENESPIDIGRVRAFSAGWLERESCFLHMPYKYILGLLKSGLYEEFYKVAETELVCNMNPEIYGRSTLENSSFIVTSVFPDKKLHGQGFFARLTGANAEYLSMWGYMLFGGQPFTYDGQLKLELKPILPAKYFDRENQVSFLFLGHTTVTYVNPKKLDTWKAKTVSIVADGRKTEGCALTGQLAEDVRSGKIKKLTVTLG